MRFQMIKQTPLLLSMVEKIQHIAGFRVYHNSVTFVKRRGLGSVALCWTNTSTLSSDYRFDVLDWTWMQNKQTVHDQ